MAKILLTNVPWYGTDWHGVRAGSRWPFIFDSPKPPENTLGDYNTMPFFMAYATNYLASMKVGDIAFYDALARKHTYETFYKNVESVKPDITIIETSTPSINNDLEVASKIKELGSEIALCGSHASAYPEEMMKYPFVDYVLRGEYEVNSYEMCLMRKKGIYESRQLKNLDNLVPYRDDGVYNYADGFGQDKYIQYPQLQIQTSRGCPYRCRFCLWNETMTCGYYRPRSVGGVIRELTGCMKHFGFKSVLFDDDTFNVGDKRTIELSKEMGKIDIQWHAMVRADSCSWKAFETMRKCGCVGVKIGIESFSQTGLDYLNKGYKAEELIKTIDFIISIGLRPFLSLMDGIPTETPEDRAKTKETLSYLVEKGCSFQMPTCMPLPGTNLFESMKDKLTDNWFEYGKFHGEVINEKDTTHSSVS